MTLSYKLYHNETMKDPLGRLSSLTLGEGEGSEILDISEEELLFDSVIGLVEDVLMDEDFLKLQKEFMEKYWQEFEDKDENKLSYMDIFKEYIEVIEKHIETSLKTKMAGFSMERFIRLLEDRRDGLEGEVFEMLFTFSDFIAFKEMFLDYRAMKEGTAVDFSSGIQITHLMSS
uniref:ADP-ribosylation factor-like protein 2-binding protein n=1 Tax=Timema bartmani TaxID=61472 RepID=A0A7R9EW52_9NEOP|nr:unnamed protein product [Timema bartmani]